MSRAIRDPRRWLCVSWFCGDLPQEHGSEPGLGSYDKRDNFRPYAGVSPSVSVVAKPDCVGRTTDFRSVQIDRYIKENHTYERKRRRDRVFCDHLQKKFFFTASRKLLEGKRLKASSNMVQNRFSTGKYLRNSLSKCCVVSIYICNSCDSFFPLALSFFLLLWFLSIFSVTHSFI